MGKSFQICLVTPGHLGSNPRLVKEADALVEAGHRVHVISGDAHPAARVRDASILERAKWTSQILPVRPGRFTYLFRRLRQEVCRKLYSAGFKTVGIAAQAHHVLVPALTSAAGRVPADIYMGHCLAALPAVVKAGRRRRVLIGFDAEDLHSGELEEQGRGQMENTIARTLESKLFPQCDHLTASSPLITEAYRALYNVQALTLVNVFPLSEAVDPQPAPAIPSFYWFSQTVGSGRGLEDFVEILRQLQRPVKLDLRGHVSDTYVRQLQERVQGTDITLQFLAPDVPRSMVPNAAGYTAGLGLELPTPLNRDLCLTNKAFTYLLAGVPVILSRTQAQAQLAADLGGAAVLIDLKDAGGSARLLAAWLNNSETQRQARDTAFHLGRDRYNWDLEKMKLIAAVNSRLNMAA